MTRSSKTYATENLWSGGHIRVVRSVGL